MQQSLSLSDYMPEAANCGDCREKISEGMSAIPGVTQIEVTRNSVSWLGTDGLKTAVEKLLGELKDRHHHRTWSVQGMDCPSCAKSIEKAIERQPGVHFGRITFARERLSVDFDPAEISQEQIKGVVTGLGYSLAEITAKGKLQPEAAVSSSCCASSQVATGCAGAKHSAVHGDSHDHADQKAGKIPSTASGFFRDPAWRKVVLTGLVLLAAVALSELLPTFFEGQARVFYSVAALIGLLPILKNTFRSLRFGQYFGIQTLMSVAAIGALVIGEALEASMVLFLFLIGEALEKQAASKAREGISLLLNLQPRTAHLVHLGGTDDAHEAGDHSHEVPAESLSVGNVIEVRPGERLPADGEILGELAILDESALTGESMPRNRERGETAFAGALVLERLARFRVTSEAGDNTLDRIVRMIEESEAHKAPVARFIDRFSSIYTPLMMLVSLLVAVVPPLLFGGDWSSWIYKSLTLLIISCPCALVISVPAAVTSSLAAAARSGLLIKGGAALEALSRAKTIAFDKTGTLTEGRPQITDVVVTQGEETELLALVAAVERGSGHPLARALVSYVEGRKIAIPAVEDAQTIAGKAARGRVGQREVMVGSPKHSAALLVAAPELGHQLAELEEAGKTVVVVTVDDQLCGLIALRDEPRATAISVIGELAGLGLKTVMLTGDNARTAKALGQELGLNVRAELLPQDKLTEINQLSLEGSVVMVGDGINDAPALKIAEVGIAMGGGTDVALEAADIALMENRLESLPALLRRARATMANIHQNVALALGLKGLFLVTTLLGMTGLWMAVVADTGATVLVTLNALRLLNRRA
ncbi:heavy metal translocating P-type ATPase [Kiloniella laminariae]|uniref:heavy metal translocating P-type ATPase n=1 Tax=Kiloniella laminariae TaxID=454162 RepID=UPI0003A04F29|nr:heavy metal translocating P-type ATPase [Kiloniella laminariae]